MDAYLDLRDVRLTGHLAQGLIALVAIVTVLGTVVDWGGGQSWPSVLVIPLMLPAAAAFGVWLRNATHNAEAIALRGVRFLTEVWRASDPAQRDKPFEDRVPSPLIKPWLYAFNGFLLFELLEFPFAETGAYLVFSVLSSVLAVGSAALISLVIFQISAMQKSGARNRRR